MGESFLQIDEGTEKKIDHYQRTISGSTVEQGRIVVAPSPVATYSIVTASTAIASANQHILQIMSGATNRTMLRELKVFQLTAAAALALVEFELYRIDTAGTGGTAITPEPVDTVDAAADSTAMVLPSSKGTEDELLGFWDGVIHATLTNATKPIIDELWDGVHRKPFTAPAGTSNGLALKCLDTDTTVDFRIVAIVEELAWS